MKRFGSWLIYLSAVGLPVWGWLFLKGLAGSKIESQFSVSAFIAFCIAITAQSYRETESKTMQYVCHSMGALFILMLSYVWFTNAQFSRNDVGLMMACGAGFFVSTIISFITYKE